MNRRIRERVAKEPVDDRILKRGFVTCDNDEVECAPCCLLSGINPSVKPGTENDRIEDSFQFAGAIEDKKNKGNTYWGKKRKQYHTIYKEMAYLDLFPLRESRQPSFEKAFQERTVLRRDLLEITQEAIEDLHPRLIIHANRASLYYWGFAPEDPWMGYEFERVNPKAYSIFPECMTLYRLELFPFYRIKGFRNHSQRINQKKYPTRTALEGTFFMEYVMEYRKKEDRLKMYSAPEWEAIWNWVKDQNKK